MSQNIDYTWVSEVQEAQNYQSQFGSLLAQGLNTAPVELAAGVKACCQHVHPVSKTMLAPTELKVIQTDFKAFKVAAQTQKEVGVMPMKVAAIATLVANQNNLQVSDQEVVVAAVQKIVEAGTVKEAETQIKTAFREIKAQHQQVFVSNVTTAVKESAVAVGFSKIDVQQPKEGMVRVVATNATGQNLIAEIDSAKQVDIRAELVGFNDGSCGKVMRAFDDEMVKRGIKTQSKVQKATNGVPQMPYAKAMTKARRRSRSFTDEKTVGQEGAVNTITINHK